MNDTTLSHHGILGQRWGVRRYQNKDGTLTAAGKRRAQQLETEYGNLTRKSLSTQSHTSTKSVSEMSDDELRQVINRKNLEKQYRDLNPKKVSTGKAIFDKVIKPAAERSSRDLVEAWLTKQGEKYLDVKVKKKK